MDGLFNLPLNKSLAKTFVYTSQPYSAGLTVNIAMHKWVKPKGCTFVYGLLIGAGGGGGGGGTVGGGGGGSPANYYQFLQPAIAMPDELWITVAPGGLGGAANTAGSASSFNSQQPFTGLWWDARGTNIGVNTAPAYGGTFYIYTVNGGGGGAGSGVAAGIAGSAAGISITETTSGIYGISNINQGLGTLTGAAGGLGTAGIDITQTSYFTGGAGGGGRSGAIQRVGGNVIPFSGGPFNTISINGGAVSGGTGTNGITLYQPTLITLGGAGGGANDSGVGGDGGVGGIGCGGGGGGAGSTTGGAGGRGGDGLIILTCW